MSEKKSYFLIRLHNFYYRIKTWGIKTIRNTEVFQSNKLHKVYLTHDKQLHFILLFTFHEQMPALQ